MARLLHGRPLAAELRARSASRSATLRARGVTPRLAVVSMGADPAAAAYADSLRRAGRAIGAEVRDVALPRTATAADLDDALDALGRNREVHGLLLLTPLPDGVDQAAAVERIAVTKDVEGLHPWNVGLLASGRPGFVPSTADAVVELLRYYEIPLRGARVLVIGRSAVVGRPLAQLLLREDATVTIAHSRTDGLDALGRQADVVAVAIGRPGYLRGDAVRPGATVVDAGTNVTPAGIVGDVDTESVARVAGALSPVPGGLGTVTTALLLRNVLTAAERQTG